MKDNKWLRLLTYVTGLVNQELLLQNEYLAAENRILRAHLPTRSFVLNVFPSESPKPIATHRQAIAAVTSGCRNSLVIVSLPKLFGLSCFRTKIVTFTGPLATIHRA